MIVTLMVPCMYCAVSMQLPGIVQPQNARTGRHSRRTTRVPAMPDMIWTVKSTEGEVLIHMLGGSSSINVKMNEVFVRA